MNNIKTNFLYNIGYQILVIILPLITAPYISRVLGVLPVGIYSYTYSIVNYFMLVAMLGIANHGNRCVASVREKKNELNIVFSNIITIQFFTHIIAIVVYIIYLLIFVSENALIAIFQGINLLSSCLDISWLFFGLEQFKITVKRNILIKVLSVALIFILVHSPADLWKYTVIMAGGAFFSQLYLWGYVKKYISFVKPCFSEIKKQLGPILILFVPVFAYSIYKVMDKIMLGSLSSFEQVAYYQNAEKIVNLPIGLITALSSVMLPRISNLMARGEIQRTDYYNRSSIKVTTVIMSSLIFGIMGISRVFALVFYGDAFKQCGEIMEYLACSTFFVGWANVIRTQYLIPKHFDKVYLISTSAGAVVNLVINVLLIPEMGAMGATIGTIVAEISVMSIQAFYVRNDFPVHKYILKEAPVLGIGLFMMCIVHVIGQILQPSFWTLAIQVLVGSVFFCICLLVYWYFSKDDLGKLLFKKLIN